MSVSGLPLKWCKPNCYNTCGLSEKLLRFTVCISFFVRYMSVSGLPLKWCKPNCYNTCGLSEKLQHFTVCISFFVREETLTSKADPLTRILMLFNYKEETSLADIIFWDLKKIADYRLRIFFGFCMGYGVMTTWFLMAFGTQSSDQRYHNQWLIRLPCGETIVKLYPIVILKFHIKLCVVLCTLDYVKNFDQYIVIQCLKPDIFSNTYLRNLMLLLSTKFVLP